MIEDEYNREKIRLTAPRLMVTIACCRVMTDLDDQKDAEWIHESADYLTGFQIIAYESLLKIRDDVSSYPETYGRFAHILQNTDKLRVLQQSNNKPYHVKMLYTYAFSGHKTHYEIEIERYESAKGTVAFYFSVKTVDEIISKLYWIMKPEVMFTGNLNQMAYEAICRSRLRARDILNRLAAELPHPQFLREHCIEGIIKSQDLQPVQGLQRDWPGWDSEDFNHQQLEEAER